MITRENIHTLGDLLETAAVDYENQVFVRYEKDGIVYEKGPSSASAAMNISQC